MPVRLPLLPPEVWECILSLVESSEDLRAASGVCHAFAELVGSIQLARSGLRQTDLDRDKLELSADALGGLATHIPVATLGAKSLSASVGVREEMTRQVRTMRQLVETAPALRNLTISFMQDTFLAPPSIRETVMNDLCSTLGALAARVSGPVVVVVAGEIINCRAKDILRWRLHRSEYHPTWTYMGHLLSERCEHIYLEYRDVVWKSMPKLRSLHSVSIQLIDSKDVPCFSLLVLNASDMVMLRLGGNYRALKPSLDAVVQRLRLPELRVLRLYSESIYPAVLTGFLLAHTKLEVLLFDPVLRDRWFTISHRSVWASRLIANRLPQGHPSLKSVHIWGYLMRASLGHLVPALVQSPRLRHLRIVFPSSMGPDRARELLADLASIAHRPAAAGSAFVLNLSEHLPYTWDVVSQYARSRYREEEFWAASPAALAIAPTLTCVTSVWLTIASSYGYARGRRMLPWLALLPSLRFFSVRFDLENMGVNGVTLHNGRVVDYAWKPLISARSRGRRLADVVMFFEEKAVLLPLLVNLRTGASHDYVYHDFWI
ncbi:hypothetical protein MKEN_00964500 [Mycena kentingensis (nom. inval.)]|nr:hypothetical protein MKEN_00964500 [Mycena kentingensis (nom. inval.)]